MRANLAMALCLIPVMMPAQTNPPTPLNPLMQLMLTQPSVDIDAAVAAKAAFDPPIVGVGKKAVYRVSVNALEASVRLPQQIVVPPGLTMTLSARGQVFHQVGKNLHPLTALNFHARAGQPGFYTVPAFDLEVYGKPVRVPATHLEVAEDSGPDHRGARELILQPARTNVFVGENLKVRVLLPGSISNVVETLAQLQFNGEGILHDKEFLHQRVEPMEFNGRRLATWVTDTSVTAFAPGKRVLAAQAFTGGLHFTGPVVLTGQATILGGPQTHLLLDSEPVAIQVRPLPSPGAVNGFGGFIGNVVLEPPVLGTNFLRVGDADRLLVTFRSADPLARLVPPPPPQVSGWQIFQPMPAEPVPAAAPAADYAAAFAYTLIPLSEEARQTPAIPFSVFDPATAAYVDLTIPPLRVKVVAEGLPTDWKPASWSGVSREEQRPSLNDLTETPGKTLASLMPLQMQPWFLPIQFLPAVALLGVWSWDRRRRFLEAHPEIVRRRQARRALRREKRALRRAAVRADAVAFARRGTSALQIAAAPGFPAEPRALVCGEVLSLFDPAEQTGDTGRVIRSFFEADARASFAPEPGNPHSLFALQSELERVLQRMEERL